jgi:hypothetical protein
MNGTGSQDDNAFMVKAGIVAEGRGMGSCVHSFVIPVINLQQYCLTAGTLLCGLTVQG